MPRVLWWGHHDPDYSRNRILRKLLVELGWEVVDFRPAASGLGHWEATLRGLPRPDLVWVPCFRQRDLAAARKWASRKGVKLLFDPLISAYDKQVLDRGKHAPDHPKARRLLAWERDLFGKADILLADTQEHARFFADTLGAGAQRIHVVPVGAEEALFQPEEGNAGDGAEHAPPLEVLFYGSFIPLQGATFIVEAARRYRGPGLRWIFIGAGPQLDACKALAEGLDNIAFEAWLDYARLPERIRQADILLGIFGTTPKAGRVIPNKLYQAMACGKPVITRWSPAYPDEWRDDDSLGLTWVPAGDPDALARAVAALASARNDLGIRGRQARAAYLAHFSNARILVALEQALSGLSPGR